MQKSDKPQETVGGKQVDKLGAKLLAAIDVSGNEFAMGYSDSGCFWRFCYGKRGAGSMMNGWPTFQSESPEIEEALDEYLRHAGVNGMANSSPEATTSASQIRNNKLQQLSKEDE